MIARQLFLQRYCLLGQRQLWAAQYNLARQHPLQFQMRTFTAENEASEQKLELNQVKSLYDKISDVVVLKNGEVIHNLYTKKDQDGNMKRRKFKDMDAFNSWKKQRIAKIKDRYRLNLTPHQFHITQNIGTERAFTGDYWWVKDVGRYDCVVCSQRLFLFEHKYINKSGYATFWQSLKDAIRFEEDNLELPRITNAHEDPTLKNKQPIKRACCSNCEAHLGYVFADGPLPLGLRFQINSASLKFEKKPWFTIPEYSKQQLSMFKFQEKIAQKKKDEYMTLINEEKMLGLTSYKDRKLAESNIDKEEAAVNRENEPETEVKTTIKTDA